MIGNNHIQLIMSIVRINNEIKSKFSKRILSKEDLKKVESKYIRIANYINRIENAIINNKFSNFLKDAFSLQMSHPLYMFSDQTNQYVYDMTDGKLEDGRKFSDVSVTDSVKYAKDFRKFNFIQRNNMLKKTNSVLAGNEQPFTVRYKSILNIEANINDGETTITT